MSIIPLSRVRLWLIGLAVGWCSASGCSLFLMGQRMFFGDPMVKSEFKTFTHVDLTKGKHKLLIVCSTPSAIDAEISTLKFDLIDGVARRLKREGISVVDPDAVTTWLDEHGGLPADPSKLARDFKDVDYIAWIDVDQFSFKEENSAGLLRGRAQGWLRVYQVSEADGIRMTGTVFNKEFTTVYPPHQPISEVNRSEEIFRHDFVHRVCDQLAHKFYDHRPGWDI
jgi:hypothetical protein